MQLLLRIHCQSHIQLLLRIHRQPSIQLVIFTLLRDQIIMRTSLDDPPLLQDHDAVRIPDCRQSVGNDERCPALHQLIHTVLHDPLCTGVNGRGRLIQNKDRWIRDCSSRDCEQLSLALRQIGAVAVQHRVIALRKSSDKAVRICQLRSRVDFLVGRVKLAVTDIVAHRRCEQVGILKNDAQRPAKVRLLDLIDVDPVVADLAVRDIIEAVDQVRDGRLPCTGRSDEGDLLPRLRVQHQRRA